MTGNCLFYYDSNAENFYMRSRQYCRAASSNHMSQYAMCARLLDFLLYAFRKQFLFNNLLKVFLTGL